VYVIGHKAKSVDAVTESACPFLKEKLKTITVFVIQKNWLPAIASKDNVVKPA